MTLDEWRKATAIEKREPCPDSEGLGFWGNELFVGGYVEEVNGHKRNIKEAVHVCE